MNNYNDYMFGELFAALELPGYNDDDFRRDVEDWKAGRLNAEFTKTGTDRKDEQSQRHIMAE